MRDLESHIASWRRDMRAAGLHSLVLEEMENHLREDVEERMQFGVALSQAFEAAVQRLGPAHVLKAEFDKTDILARHSRIHAVLLAALALHLAATASMFCWLADI